VGEGYIKLHRCLLESAVWHMPGGHIKVFLTILACVKWRDAKAWDGSQEVEVPAGSMLTSLSRLAEMAGVGVQVVRGALRNLEKCQIVTQKATKQHRVISVINWHKYQSREEGANKRPTNDQQSYICKKEGKNIYNTHVHFSDTPLAPSPKPLAPKGKTRTRERLEQVRRVWADVAQYWAKEIGNKRTQCTPDRESNTKRILESFGWNEDSTARAMKRVIWSKHKAWGESDRMRPYLEPKTLFCKKHFEEYLEVANEELGKPRPPSGNGKVPDMPRTDQDTGTGDVYPREDAKDPQGKRRIATSAGGPVPVGKLFSGMAEFPLYCRPESRN
jgi:uncharacterized phage protein (TIGR02220 family)